MKLTVVACVHAYNAGPVHFDELAMSVHEDACPHLHCLVCIDLKSILLCLPIMHTSPCDVCLVPNHVSLTAWMYSGTCL